MTDTPELPQLIPQITQKANSAAQILAQASTEQKNEALQAMANQLHHDQENIVAANQKDLLQAKEKELSAAMVDRLVLDPSRLQKMITAIENAIKLPDPVGRTLRSWKNDAGVDIEKVTVPLGVIAIIYESRPNVTSDAATLCLKSGNAVILRGGSEAFYSNQAIAASLQKGLEQADLPASAIQLIPSRDRAAIPLLCQQEKEIACIIPRGGKGLIQTVLSHARMPVIKHDDGICIAYIDKSADLAMAQELLLNAKCQRPGVCNAIETLLIHQDIASDLLATAGKTLLQAGVSLRCEPTTFNFLDKTLQEKYSSQLQKATSEDFQTEFLSLILAVKTVASLDEAIEHIAKHSSHHSEMIVAQDSATAETFLHQVDSAAVYWNASTRFSDGGAFGFGAEIGISTDKLHARGPMGLEELTSYQYRLRGDGHIRTQ